MIRNENEQRWRNEFFLGVAEYKSEETFTFYIVSQNITISCEIINNKNIQNSKMPDNEEDSTTNQHHHILSLQTNASLIRVVNSKI